MLRAYIYILLLTSIMPVLLIGQEQAQFTQYMYNKYEFNPAFAGLEGSLNVYAGIRNQWSNLELKPTSYILNADMPIYKINGAMGMKIEKDKTGYLNDNRILISYNYIQSNNLGLVSGGIGVGYRQLSIDGSQLLTPEGEYGQVVNHNDPILSDKLFNASGLVWNMGLVFTNNFFEIGLSISNVGFNKLISDRYESYTNHNYQLFFQYNYIISKGLLIMPMAKITTDLNTSKIDISMVLDYYGKIFAGFSVQMNNKIRIPAFGITVGGKINQNIKLHYSYDKDFSSLKTLHDGTHEIVLNYNLNKIIGKRGVLPIIYSPRNL